MKRALVNVPYTLEATLFAGSTATDPAPDSALVTVTRADGTAVLTSQATNNTGTGTFARTLTAAQMGLLDTLTATWTGTLTGGEPFTLRTHTEVVGGFLCTLSEIKALFPTADDEEAGRIRTVAEQRLERVIGARVPRYGYESHYARRNLRVDHGPIRAVRSLSVDGYAYGASALDALVLADRTIYLSARLGGAPRFGYGAVQIGYEFGHDYPDETVREAVKLVASETFDTNSDGRVIRREADGQAVTYASPSSGGGFMDPTLRAMVADLAQPLVA